jgi:hypothetical protein
VTKQGGERAQSRRKVNAGDLRELTDPYVIEVTFSRARPQLTIRHSTIFLQRTTGSEAATV